MAVRAFSIADALIALRWAGHVRSRGYRVIITPNYANADEVIEVYIPSATAPTFKVHRTDTSVRVTDCLGLTLSFPMLVDALLVMAPLASSEKRDLLKGENPAWLPAVPARPVQKVRDPRSSAGRSILRAAAIVFGRHRGGSLKSCYRVDRE